MKLAEKIVSLRKNKGLSQEELAEQLHISRQAVSRWEMGTAFPDASNIIQLSKTLEVSTDYLLTDEYESKKASNSMNLQTELLLQMFLQAICIVFHIINCFVLNFFPFLSLISLMMNLFIMIKFNNEINYYEIKSDIIKKYYIPIYIIIIWSMQYISILTWRFLENITDLLISELAIPILLICILGIIVSIKKIQSKGEH